MPIDLSFECDGTVTRAGISSHHDQLFPLEQVGKGRRIHLLRSDGFGKNKFRSGKNGRVYIIANILPQPCRHCDPRYPLAIAEVDPKHFWVTPETVVVIEDRKPRHPQHVRFSNWQRIEDRETGNPVIFLTESRADSIIPGTPGRLIPSSYRYELALPD